MSASRIEEAMSRLNAAMARIDAARVQIAEAAASSSDEASAGETGDSAGSARVMALVNAHEKLREEVAETIGQIDTLIDELEG